MRGLAVMLMLWAVAGPRDARALILVDRFVEAQADIATEPVLPDIDRGSNVSVAVSAGTFGQPFEVRSAARGSISDSTELAANFFVEDRDFGFRNANTSGFVRVTKLFEVDEDRPVNIFVNFTLPPGFLELEDNQETGAATGLKDLSLRAELQVCDRIDCEGAREVVAFLFDAELVGNYDGISSSGFDVMSDDPILDLSHFDDDAVDVDDQGFLRIFTLDYDTFQGRAFAGVWNPGDEVTVRYSLTAFLFNSEFATSRALGAINDPFFLDTDPVTAFDNVSVEAVELPEPGAGLLLATAIAGLRLRPPRR